MNILEIIAKKRDKKELSKEEIEYFVKEYVAENVTDYQAAALVMAIYINGMNDREITDLTLAMAHSGDVLDLSDLGEVVDIYSTKNYKINYDYRGHLLSSQTDLGNGDRFDNMGNSYLLKNKDGKYFLFYEGATHKSNWEICLMTCDDLYAKREDGFVGNWKQCPNNPIMPYTKKDFAGETTHVYCNPEIAKGEDNQPLIVDGKYYMYYLS